ncbi:MAG: HypC/HybG/HupF family hydrogenase formation chaperone [Caldimicrobium sp.]|nr:HypC/HybG/HupF family hydrogenase formation chaperone [Caldimicrobium sp.]MCX7873380.1 HypC/HybG/HupF family hydrogenase formation chaperone [Caldimicrobium sp.]MDW8093790.1 HypC/HybG/HupF family hydrogenase formation chaperone [Caldimicrobium sp.]
MCLAYPYQIVEIINPYVAKASIDGVSKEIYISLLAEEVKPGDWVLVHVGFAIQKIREEEAIEALNFYRQLLSDETGF